jgi:signal transduction histidine kinase
MTDSIFLHLYEQHPSFIPNETLLNNFQIESNPYDPIHLLERTFFILLLEVDLLSENHLENIKRSFNRGKPFSIVLLTTHPIEKYVRWLSLLTQCVVFPIPLTAKENNAINTALFPMAKVQWDHLHYIETLKIRSNRSRLVDSLNVVAHQWRQPINLISMEAINLSIQSTLETSVSSESIQKSTKIISEQSQRMADILKSVLNMGKTLRGREPFSINEMIDRIEFFFLDQLQKNRITFLTSKLAEDNVMQGYQTDMEEVLVNLILNAKDALVSSSVKEKVIHLELQSTDETILFSVRDNAGGIPKELRDKIFEPHFSTKGEGEGFGIGLHVARMIIEQEFKGSLLLTIDSEETHFTITLPRNDITRLTFINT